MPTATHPFEVPHPAHAPSVEPSAWESWTAMLLSTQSAQVELLMAWQKSLDAVRQELWDSWTCRFAGGIPIDG